MAVLATIPGWLLIIGAFQLWLGGARYAALGDGLCFWSAAHLVLSGQSATLFDPQRYVPWFAAHFGGSLHTWGYPPSFLLFILPFGLLPPSAGVFGFDLTSFGCLLLALRVSGFDWTITAAVLFCPAALASVSGGQNGAFIASLLIAGLFLSETRPWIAGALIGVATIKPQLGMLIPVYWLARGAWRPILAAAFTSGLLILVSALVFGLQSWVLFIGKVYPFMANVMVELTAKAPHGPRAMIMSSFSLSYQLGLGGGAAKLAQLASTIGALAITWKLGRDKRAGGGKELVLILLLTIFTSPYIWFYDMIPASLAAAVLIRSAMITGFLPAELVVLGALWVMPSLALAAAILGWPTLVPLLAAGSLLYAWAHLQQASG